MTGYPLQRPGRPEAASEAAANWVLRRERGELGEDDERRFSDWLDEDPANVTAYIDGLWALDAVARHAGDPQILALRNAALAARGERRRRWVGVGSLGLAMAAALAAVMLWTTPQRAPSAVEPTSQQAAHRAGSGEAGVFRTGIGERSSITLADGSIVTLDTNSEIRVDYSEKARAIHLVNGQALFEVAHGKPAPFQVYARGQVITAVGTIFNVRTEGRAVRVSMVEGRVNVGPAAHLGEDMGAGWARPLVPGDAALAQPEGGIVVTRGINPQQVASWKGGFLIFNDVPLANAVAEINRYTEHPIAIADSAVGAYRISGVFKSSDPEHFSRAMAEVLPIEVTHAPDGAPTLRARGD